MNEHRKKDIFYEVLKQNLPNYIVIDQIPEPAIQYSVLLGSNVANPTAYVYELA